MSRAMHDVGRIIQISCGWFYVYTSCIPFKHKMHKKSPYIQFKYIFQLCFNQWRFRQGGAPSHSPSRKKLNNHGDLGGSRVLFDVLLNRTGVLVGVHQIAGLVGQAIGVPTALHQEGQVTQAGIQDLGLVMAR